MPRKGEEVIRNSGTTRISAATRADREALIDGRESCPFRDVEAGEGLC